MNAYEQIVIKIGFFLLLINKIAGEKNSNRHN